MTKLAYFNLPDVGEGLTEAEIVSWKVKPGDSVAVNQVICEIETAKSLVEFRAQVLGLIAGVEKDPLVFGFEHPCVYMPSAEGECEAVDFGWNRCLGPI